MYRDSETTVTLLTRLQNVCRCVTTAHDNFSNVSIDSIGRMDFSPVVQPQYYNTFRKTYIRTYH